MNEFLNNFGEAKVASATKFPPVQINAQLFSLVFELYTASF
jgi:hypothetical protein